MIVFAGANLILPDRVLPGGSVVVDGDCITDIRADAPGAPGGATVIDARDYFLAPGFVDVHVHGVGGTDTLDGDRAVADIAARLPQFGVTAFCPTTVACTPDALGDVLRQVRQARLTRPVRSARVLAAHLESNFINPQYRGAQPSACLRVPLPGGDVGDRGFKGDEILDVVAQSAEDVGIVTLAPELPGGIDLIRRLVASGHDVSIGHTGATFDETIAAIEAGASRATHLFNRMTPMSHRAPGAATAMLGRRDVLAELICDGHHVHPGMCQAAIAAKGVTRVAAITDGTAASGLPVGAYARLGQQRIRTGPHTAVLDDGTMAGSTLTMDGALRTLVGMGFSLVDAVTMCATTPARDRRLTGLGLLAVGATADCVLLTSDLTVARTFVGGKQVFPVEPPIADGLQGGGR